MTGSRRVSLNDEAPPLLVARFPPLAIKLLTAAFLRYSSSTCRLFWLRTNINTPPAMAAIATIPTTTPAAMAALFGPPPLLVGLADGDAVLLIALPAVTTTVWPPTVTTEGGAVVVGEGVFDDVPADVVLADALAVSTKESSTRPLVYTVK
jgi:hypothetical protein